MDLPKLDEYHKQAKERLLSKIQIDDKTGWWNWVGSVSQNGYGRIAYKYARGWSFEAYRLSYMLFKKTVISSNLQIDHICENKRCCNPTHLREVTQQQNILRGKSVIAINARKTQCPKGHEYNKENTRYYKNGRSCRKCENIRGKIRYKPKAIIQYAKNLLIAESVIIGGV